MRDPRPIGRFFLGDFWAAGAASRQSGYYRPLTLLSYAAQRQASGLEPLPFRIANLAIHAVAVLLLWSLAGRLGLGPAAALGVALIFAVHPVHVESVAWISGRTDVLAAAFALAALVMALGRAALWPAVAAAFLASLLAKESAALLPLLVLLSPAFGNLGRRLSALAAFTLAASVYLTLRLRALPPPRLEPRSLLHVAGEAGTSLLAYAGKVLWPLRLPLDMTVPSPGAAAPLLALLLVAVLVAAALLAARGRLEGAGLLLFVLGLAPVLGFVPLHDSHAVRFLYLPCAGLLLALAPAAGAILSRLPAPGRALAGGSVVILLAMLAARRSADFRSDEALFTAERRLSPRSVTMAMNLGETFRRSGRITEAADYYTGLARELPAPQVEVARVRSLREAGKLDESAAAAKEALARLDEVPEIHAEAGLTLIAQGYPALGREQLERAIALDPDAIAPRFNLALLFTQMGRAEDALAVAEPGLERQPASPELQLVKALALRRAGRHQEALSILEDLTRRLPGRKEHWIELGDCAFALGMYRTARQALSMARTLDPDSLRALSGLALVDLAEGKLDDALVRQLRVVKESPADVEARMSLAAIYLRKDDRASAARELREVLRRRPDHPSAAVIARQVAALEAPAPPAP